MARDGESGATEGTTGAGARLRRRGVFAGVAAVAVAAVAARTTEKVAAANGDPLLVGRSSITGQGPANTATLATELQFSGAAGQGAGFVVQAGMPLPVATYAFPATIAGWSNSAVNADGISGRATQPNGFGVFGTNESMTGGAGVGVGGLGVSGVGVFGDSIASIGVFGTSQSADGVRGTTVNGAASTAGVRGETSGAANSFGVWGRGLAAGTLGVFGDAAGVAVQGQTSGSGGGAIGVAGATTGGAGGFGVFGQGNGTGTTGVFGTGNGGTGIGVRGVSVASNGVIGTSTSGDGVRGDSTTGYGVLGVTTGGSASLAGISTNINIPAFAGGNSVAGGLAARFNGGVFIDGNLVVTNPSYKSGIIAHPDGTHRRVYCVEAPRSYIEDFGEGTVTNGRAEVAFDADFVALTQTDRYHVFLTPHGGDALNLVGRTARGFSVEVDATHAAQRGRNAAQVSGTFSYRVVAAPKGDTSSRFATYDLPKPWKVEVPPAPPLTPPVVARVPDAPPAAAAPPAPRRPVGAGQPPAPQPPAAPTAPAAPGGNPAPAPPRR